MSTLEQIKKLQNLRNRLLKDILSFRLMIPGSFKEVYRKCGKQNCWCHDKPGHLLRRITWSENGISKSKAVPEQEVEWIKKSTSNYRELRKKRRDLQKFDKDLKGLLDFHEKDVIKKSRLMRDYLQPKTCNPADQPNCNRYESRH